MFHLVQLWGGGVQLWILYYRYHHPRIHTDFTICRPMVQRWRHLSGRRHYTQTVSFEFKPNSKVFEPKETIKKEVVRMTKQNISFQGQSCICVLVSSHSDTDTDQCFFHRRGLLCRLFSISDLYDKWSPGDVQRGIKSGKYRKLPLVADRFIHSKTLQKFIVVLIHLSCTCKKNEIWMIDWWAIKVPVGWGYTSH